LKKARERRPQASVTNALLGGMLFPTARDPRTNRRGDEHWNGKNNEYDNP
jgi:hypothetical protein